MARELSLSFRNALNAEATEDAVITLVTITHPELDSAIRLSSDPTRRISVDPLRYGTVAEGVIYDFVLMSVIFPDDRMGAPAAVTLAFANVADDMAAVIRAALSPARVDIRCVLATAPDVVEEEWLDLRGVQGSYDDSRITYDVSREAISNEPWPAHRMTQARFPRLYVG
ncbi:DUF1833 family protein [Hyphomicrobium sp.]|uniref:DUF1833 family protein n=1 Tax=Hyphomicrobium sp. TaxID=82 RepID=UPI001327FBE9|nr:DUF1833 family protein [Hyphomicrobium sp.]KAB2937397.1 MAG: DUF1833 domain-containing protein [Hyphomicrobium sp.]